MEKAADSQWSSAAGKENVGFQPKRESQIVLLDKSKDRLLDHLRLKQPRSISIRLWYHR
jgi:hypothetical protein